MPAVCDSCDGEAGQEHGLPAPDNTLPGAVRAGAADRSTDQAHAMPAVRRGDQDPGAADEMSLGADPVSVVPGDHGQAGGSDALPADTNRLPVAVRAGADRFAEADDVLPARDDQVPEVSDPADGSTGAKDRMPGKSHVVSALPGADRFAEAADVLPARDYEMPGAVRGYVHRAAAACHQVPDAQDGVPGQEDRVPGHSDEVSVDAAVPSTYAGRRVPHAVHVGPNGVPGENHRVPEAADVLPAMSGRHLSARKADQVSAGAHEVPDAVRAATAHDHAQGQDAVPGDRRLYPAADGWLDRHDSVPAVAHEVSADGGLPAEAHDHAAIAHGVQGRSHAVPGDRRVRAGSADGPAGAWHDLPVCPHSMPAVEGMRAAADVDDGDSDAVQADPHSLPG